MFCNRTIWGGNGTWILKRYPDVYQPLCGWIRQEEVWGSVMFLSAEEFQTYSLNIFSVLKDSNRKIFQAWIVPERFNVLCYINDLRYLEGNRIPQIVWEAKGKLENLAFVKATVLESSSPFKLRKIMWPRTLQNITREEMQFIGFWHFVPVCTHK